MAAFPSACIASYDLPEVLGLISHLAQTFWISSYLSETPSRLPHPHPGCFRTGSGSLFLLGQFCLSKKLFPPHIQLPACLSVCPTFIHPLAYPASNQSSISLPPDSSVHTYIHLSTQSSTYLPTHTFNHSFIHPFTH